MHRLEFRSWAVTMLRELETLRPGVHVTARGESRVLAGFAGRMVTIERDGHVFWLTFDGPDAPAAARVERHDAVSAAQTARRLAAFFGP
jgi:hypothetical protein